MDDGKNKEIIKEHIGKMARKLGYDTTESVFSLSLSDILLEGVIEIYGNECLRISPEEFEEAMQTGIAATEYIDWYDPIQTMIDEYRKKRKLTAGSDRAERSAA